MSGFRFRLETALGWRRRQLEAEEHALERETAEAIRWAVRIAEAREEQARTERELIRNTSLTAAELVAYDGWRATLERRARLLTAEAARQELKVEAQRARVMDATRRVRLLERLKERRLAEWSQQVQKELDDMAGDSYLARWTPTR